MTEDEAEAYNKEVKRLGRSKLAEIAESNQSGNGVMPA